MGNLFSIGTNSTVTLDNQSVNSALVSVGVCVVVVTIVIIGVVWIFKKM
jgi:hypothetical protein